jgi:hypothetical protein
MAKLIHGSYRVVMLNNIFTHITKNFYLDKLKMGDKEKT